MNHAANATPDAGLTNDQPSNRPESGVNPPVDSPAHESGGTTEHASGTEGASVRVLRSTEEIMACLQALRKKNDPSTSAHTQKATDSPAQTVSQSPPAKSDTSADPKPATPQNPVSDSAQSDPAPSGASEAASGSGKPIPPEQWSAHEKEAFHALPSALQRAISQHDQTVKAEADRLKKQQQAYEALHMESAQTLAPLVQAAHAALMGDLARINWTALQNSNPQEYARLRHECDSRLAAIEAIRRQGQACFAEARQVEAAREQARLQTHVHREFEQIVPTLKALMGEAYSNDFRQSVSTYLKQQDVPESALSQITNGYELKLIVKAMLYDRLMTTRDQAAAKVAGAPQVQRAKGRPVTSDADARERFHKARVALSHNPRSTDLIVQMLRASRG